MPQIQQLDPHVADLIAAGEVVERPASVVKELMENAIDAGASNVTVEIENGGMTLIRVTDDGCGIAPGELKTAFLRHATSKIRSERDLEAIGTLGFRGEALAAIASVARVEVLTCTPDAPLGAALTLEGGIPGQVEEIGCPKGTTMLVRDLFYNTPARLKFMKRDSAEGAAVTSVVHRVALSHPEVSVKYIREGKQELLTPGDGTLQSAIYAVLGRDLALGFLPVKSSGEGVTVEGFVSLPVCCRGTRGYQHFFVNGRYVKSRTMTAALEEAYRNQKMVGKFPGCVLHVTTRPSAVDVNVHPTKTEVKFVSEKSVFDSVYYAVLSGLNGDRSRPTVEIRPRVASDTAAPDQTVLRAPELNAPGPIWSTARPTIPSAPASVGAPPRQKPLPSTGAGPIPQVKTRSTGIPPAASGQLHRPTARGIPVFWEPPQTETLKQVPSSGTGSRPGAVIPQQRESVPAVRSPLPKEKALIPSPGPTPQESSPEPPAPENAPSRAAPLPASEAGASTFNVPSWHIAGEVLRTYIIVEQGDKILFIDKHAAHERMNFDRLRSESYDPMSQQLLSPIVVKLPSEEKAALLEQLPLLERYGFEVEDFGGDALNVHAAPFDIPTGRIEETLSELAFRLLTTGTADPAPARDELLHTMACKAAIKGGWKNAREELEAVAAAVMADKVRYCPHGRPVAIEMTRQQLEKQFRRS